MPWGQCSGLLSFLASGLCCQWSLETLGLLSSSKEPPAQLVLKMPPLDVYNLADCQTMPGLSLVVKYMQLFVVREFAWCQMRTQIRTSCLSVFANQGVVEGLSAPLSSQRKCPVCFLLGPSTVLNSLHSNVVLYKPQSWERTAQVALPWRGRLCFPSKAKSGNSSSQHPVARGFAVGGLPTSKAAQGASGATGPEVLCACRSQPSILMPLSVPVTQFPKEIRM